MITLEVDAQLHIDNSYEHAGLTTIVLDTLYYGDTIFDIAGNDLTVKEGSTELVRIEDFFLTRANGLAEGAATTAFEFEDLIYRVGTDKGDILNSSKATKDVLFHGLTGNDMMIGGSGFDIVDQNFSAAYI